MAMNDKSVAKRPAINHSLRNLCQGSFGHAGVMLNFHRLQQKIRKVTYYPSEGHDSTHFIVTSRKGCRFSAKIERLLLNNNAHGLAACHGWEERNLTHTLKWRIKVSQFLVYSYTKGSKVRKR